MDGVPHPDNMRGNGVYTFERCLLDPVSRRLVRDGVQIKLPARLFETLLYMVENPGRPIDREELMAAVWRDRTVDDANLRRAVSSLRQALSAAGVDDSLIVTAPGRGYRFGTRVAFAEAGDSPASRPALACGLTVAATQAGEPEMTPLAGVLRQHAPLPRRLWLGAASAALAALVGVFWIVSPALVAPAPNAIRVAAGAPPPQAVAVLAFANVSGDATQDYLAQGIADELINSLGRVDGLRVAARVSSTAFRPPGATAQDIGRRLNVAQLLEGSVQRAGNHIHITTQLVDASTGFQLWSRRFDTPETGLLSVEGQIAEQVVTSAKGVVLDGDMARLRLGGTANAQAFDADLSGLVAMNAVNGDRDREAITAFGAAVAADPEFAEAYAHRAQAETYLAVNGGTKDSAESVALLAAAQRDSEQAVRLAPNLAAAHAALGSVLRFQLTDLGRAETEYRRAAEISPQDANILMNEALFQAELGHAGLALAAARHALILDPLQPTNYRFLAEILLDAGLFDDAQTQLRHASNLQPLDANQDRIALALVQLAKGDMHGAARTCGGRRDFYDLACLAKAEYAIGDPSGAEAALAALRATLGDQAAYVYAGIYASWGRQENAIYWLRRAYQLRDPGLIHINIETSLRPLRGTQAFQDIVKAMKFPT